MPTPLPGPSFSLMYPLCSALKIAGKPLLPVVTGAAVHPLYDTDDVKTALGNTRYTTLTTGTKWVAQVYSTGHRVWPGNHADPNKANCEVHCIAADDLERFLKAGN